MEARVDAARHFINQVYRSFYTRYVATIMQPYKTKGG